MASLPPSQRRQSPTQRPGSPDKTVASSSQSIQRNNSDAHSAISEDSQTILLNPSPKDSTARSRYTEEKDQDKQVQTSSQAASQPDHEPRRCWICYETEEADTPTTSEWRSPCPCALTAHEQCLLDWIADLEAPTSRRRRSPNDKILCPQCKSEIKLVRPKRYIVDGVRALQMVKSQLVLPSGLALGITSFWYLCWVHGASSVLFVFGQEDTERLLAPLAEAPPPARAGVDAIATYWKTRLRLDLALFSIPSMLIFSRTRLADGFLPILPIIFFVTKPDSDPLKDIGSWPPSAGLSFALLPYIRSLYNTAYDYLFREHEKRWLKEIQPRATTEAENEGDNAQNAGNIDAEENILEINVDLGMLDDWAEDDEQEEGQNPAANVVPAQAHPLNARPLDADAAAPAPDVPRQRQDNADLGLGAPQQPLADANPQPPAERGNFNMAVSTSRVFESIFGALAFPAASGLMGELLFWTLPKSLTRGTGRVPDGILKQKWGRSLVGGCMLVVLKDAVMLYVRWRVARDHRMRRVLDYTGKKKNRGGSGPVGV